MSKIFKELKLVLVDHIIGMKGPVLSHFRSSTHEDYVLALVKIIDEVNRYYMFKTDMVSEFRTGTKTIRDLILQNLEGYVHIVDVTPEIPVWSLKYEGKLSVSDIPDDVFPSEDSFCPSPSKISTTIREFRK